jgi:hypothetical protein
MTVKGSIQQDAARGVYMAGQGFWRRLAEACSETGIPLAQIVHAIEQEVHGCRRSRREKLDHLYLQLLELDIGRSVKDYENECAEFCAAVSGGLHPAQAVEDARVHLSPLFRFVNAKERGSTEIAERFRAEAREQFELCSPDYLASFHPKYLAELVRRGELSCYA